MPCTQKEDMMSFRTDLDDLMISLSSFQRFDHGEEIEEIVPVEYDPLPGDFIYWYCGQFYGTAKITGCEVSGKQRVCTVEKVS